jgi:hypothetical protein
MQFTIKRIVSRKVRLVLSRVLNRVEHQFGGGKKV